MNRASYELLVCSNLVALSSKLTQMVPSGLGPRGSLEKFLTSVVAYRVPVKLWTSLPATIQHCRGPHVAFLLQNCSSFDQESTKYRHKQPLGRTVAHKVNYSSTICPYCTIRTDLMYGLIVLYAKTDAKISSACSPLFCIEIKCSCTRKIKLYTVTLKMDMAIIQWIMEY